MFINFRNCPIPTGIIMKDASGTTLNNLNQYGLCKSIEIIDRQCAIDLRIVYEDNKRIYDCGALTMPRPPLTTGIYNLVVENRGSNIEAYWVRVDMKVGE